MLAETTQVLKIICISDNESERRYNAVAFPLNFPHQKLVYGISRNRSFLRAGRRR